MTAPVDGTRGATALIVGPTRHQATELFGTERERLAVRSFREFAGDGLPERVDYLAVADGTGMAAALRTGLAGLADGRVQTLEVVVPGEVEQAAELRSAVLESGRQVAGVRRVAGRPCLTFLAEDVEPGPAALLDAVISAAVPSDDAVRAAQELAAAQWELAAAREQAARAYRGGAGPRRPSRGRERPSPDRSRATTRSPAPAPVPAPAPAAGVFALAAARLGGRRRAAAILGLALVAGLVVVLVCGLAAGGAAAIAAAGALIALMTLAAVVVGSAVLAEVLGAAGEERLGRVIARLEAAERRAVAERRSLRGATNRLSKLARRNLKATSRLEDAGRGTRTAISDARVGLSTEVQGLVSLYSMVDVRGPVPPMGGWVASADLISLAVSTLVAERPRVVLETGSGVSTLFFALAARQHGIDTRIIALEHDAHYAVRTRRLLADHGVADRAEVRLAPLAPSSIAGHDTPWYDEGAVADLDDIGLVLVDGPPEATGPRPRYPLVPLIKDRLAQRCTILVDDQIRSEDAAVTRTWTALLPDFDLDLIALSKGAACFRRPAP